MSSSVERVTRWPAYPVVILGRRVGAFSPVAVPETFGIRDGCYDERIHAVSFDWDGRACTVVGLHTPNAGTRGQSDKEEVYRQFAEWVAPLAAAGPLIAALDTNNGHWRLSPDPERADMVHQRRFLRQPETANLREAYFDVYDGTAPKPATWRSHFYDRVFLSEDLRATSFTTDIEPFRRQESDGTRLLPDHAAVWADVEWGRDDDEARGGMMTTSLLGHPAVWSDAWRAGREAVRPYR